VHLVKWRRLCNHLIWSSFVMKVGRPTTNMSIVVWLDVLSNWEEN
jgi:hypothetical protein